MNLKQQLQAKQVDMWTAVKAMVVSTGVFVIFVVIAQLQFWANANSISASKAGVVAVRNWDLQVKVYEGEAAKFEACLASAATRKDLHTFGDNIFNLIDGLLVEANAPEDPYLNSARDSRNEFNESFNDNLINCQIPVVPTKPTDSILDSSPSIPTIPEEYLDLFKTESP